MGHSQSSSFRHALQWVGRRWRRGAGLLVGRPADFARNRLSDDWLAAVVISRGVLAHRRNRVARWWEVERLVLKRSVMLLGLVEGLSTASYALTTWRRLRDSPTARFPTNVSFNCDFVIYEAAARILNQDTFAAIQDVLSGTHPKHIFNQTVVRISSGAFLGIVDEQMVCFLVQFCLCAPSVVDRL